jgi:hypothetical protein
MAEWNPMVRLLLWYESILARVGKGKVVVY